MERFTFLSGEGDSLFLARRLHEDGHDVKFYCFDDAVRRGRVGEGLVDLLATPRVRPGDVVVFDSPGLGRRGMALRRAGHPVLGGHALDDQLELDRLAGTHAMVAAGIRVPKTQGFQTVAEARAFLVTHGGTWYVKPHGNAATAMTHHGPAESLGPWLQWAESKLAGEPFELQQQVKGTEVSCEGWFDGKKWVPPFNATLEEKHFLAGNVGPRTGCESNLVWTYDTPMPLLAERSIAKMTDQLRRARYCGPIDLNMMISDTGVPIGLEFSPRLGFDASQALSLLIEGDLGDQLAAFARGKLDRFRVRPERALTLRVTVPPYPHAVEEALKEAEGLPLPKAILSDPKRYCVTDVRLRRGEPVLAGTSGYVCSVGARGWAMDALRADVLKMARGLDLPEKQFRNDPVSRYERDWKALEDLGLTPKEPATARAAA